MKTVQMTLDEQLVKAVDSAAKKLGKTRSGFTRESAAFRTQGSPGKRIGVETPPRFQT
jgi:hypothetical protein